MLLCGKCGLETEKLYTVSRLGLSNLCLPCGRAATAANPESKEDRARRLRNRSARARYATMKSLGLTRTRYGWE